CQQVYTKPLTF
nr:immunoglobulin light chain junction region [Macaca mulatta]